MIRLRQIPFNIFPAYITLHFSSSLTRSSIKCFSDNWLGQPQSSHLSGRMKENDIKTKWEWPPGAWMDLQWRNPSAAPDSLDVFSPEEAPGLRLTSSTTLLRRSFHYRTINPPPLLQRNTVTDMKLHCSPESDTRAIATKAADIKQKGTCYCFQVPFQTSHITMVVF